MLVIAWHEAVAWRVALIVNYQAVRILSDSVFTFSVKSAWLQSQLLSQFAHQIEHAAFNLHRSNIYEVPGHCHGCEVQSSQATAWSSLQCWLMLRSLGHSQHYVCAVAQPFVLHSSKLWDAGPRLSNPSDWRKTHWWDLCSYKCLETNNGMHTQSGILAGHCSSDLHASLRFRHGNPDQKLFPVEERGTFLATTYLQASARPGSMQYTWYLQTAFEIKSSKEESCSTAHSTIVQSHYLW